MKLLIKINGFLFFLFFVSALASGCKSFKHLKEKSTKSVGELSMQEQLELRKSLQSKALNYDYLNLRAKANITIKGKDQPEVNLQIRIKKDEIIWISATAFLGTEVGRLLITPREIQVINRMDNTFMKVEELQIGVGREENIVEFLQQVLLGLPILLADSSTSLLQNQTEFSIQNQMNSRGFLDQRIDRDQLNLKMIKLDKGDQVVFQALYDWTKNIPSLQNSSFTLPGKLTLNIQGMGLDVQSSFLMEKLSIEENLAFPFTIPKNYQEVYFNSGN